MTSLEACNRGWCGACGAGMGRVEVESAEGRMLLCSGLGLVRVAGLTFFDMASRNSVTAPVGIRGISRTSIIGSGWRRRLSFSSSSSQIRVAGRSRFSRDVARGV